MLLILRAQQKPLLTVFRGQQEPVLLFLRAKQTEKFELNVMILTIIRRFSCSAQQIKVPRTIYKFWIIFNGSSSKQTIHISPQST